MVQANELISIIAVVGFIALFGAGTVLGLSAMQDAVTYQTSSVTNETEASSGSVPEIVQADTVQEGLVNGSETLYLNDSYDNTVYELNSSQYDVESYEQGEFNVTVADLDGDATVEINSTSDTYKLSYEYKESTKADNFISKSINAFGIVPGLLKVIVVFGFVSVLIGLLWFAMGRMGLKGGRGGL